MKICVLSMSFANQKGWYGYVYGIAIDMFLEQNSQWYIDQILL
jgi:uncharacterized membrane protein YagU involved in acid resistance